MKAKEFVGLLEEIHGMELSSQKAKSHDYAGDDDTLQNFKVVAAMTKALGLPIEEPWAVAMWFKLTKIQRMVNLMKKGVEPKNEGLLDTVMDDRQYTLLGYACYTDREERSK